MHSNIVYTFGLDIRRLFEGLCEAVGRQGGGGGRGANMGGGSHTSESVGFGHNLPQVIPRGARDSVLYHNSTLVLDADREQN